MVSSVVPGITQPEESYDKSAPMYNQWILGGPKNGTTFTNS